MTAVAPVGPTKDEARALRALLLGDPRRRRVLEVLHQLAPDAWITGGFVRNSIWDERGHTAATEPLDDVDVIVFQAGDSPKDVERDLVGRLRTTLPEVPWSVRNQARMHHRSGDEPYDSLVTAIRFFPDTASAVAVRLRVDGTIEILAPYGLTDAFAGLVRPTPASRGHAPDRYAERLERKAQEWQRRWPWLRIEVPRQS